MKGKEVFSRIAVFVQMTLWSFFVVLVLFEFILIVKLIAG
jgi:hypothetical protein